MIGSRHSRHRVLAKEMGTVEWSHGASDPDSGKVTFIPWKIQEMQELIQDFERRTKRTTRQGQKFSKYRLTVSAYGLNTTDSANDASEA